MPQQNGVVERKNITLVEMARTMLNEHATPGSIGLKLFLLLAIFLIEFFCVLN